MMLTGTGRSRERILAFGMEGVGKSLLALDIAARCAPNKLHVIDNDNAWDRMLEGQTLGKQTVQVEAEFRWDGDDWVADHEYAVDGGNVTVWHVDDTWEAHKAAIQSVSEEVGRHDWCLIDSGSQLWSGVQDWFIRKVFGQEVEDYFMQVRMEKARLAEIARKAGDKEAKSLGALDGWMDWPVINKEYNAHAGKFLVNPPCNLIVTAELAQISKEDDQQTKALYTAAGKPKGQKRLGHNMQTVVYLRRDAGGDYYASTLKDRGGRVYLENECVTGYGFGEWYLEEVAGWAEQQPQQTLPSSSSSTGPVSGSPIKKLPVAKSAPAMVAKG